MIVISSDVKKIWFLSFGIILVIAILSLPKEGLSSDMKRIARDTVQGIERVVTTVYNEVRSFVQEFKEA